LEAVNHDATADRIDGRVARAPKLWRGKKRGARAVLNKIVAIVGNGESTAEWIFTNLLKSWG